MTHYLPAFTVKRGEQQQAVCGAFVDAGQHRSEPECPRCAAWIAELSSPTSCVFDSRKPTGV